MNAPPPSGSLWTPSAERVEGSAMHGFAVKTARFHGLDPMDHGGLLDWSIREPDAFHAMLWDECGVIGEKGVAAFSPGETILGAEFYPGSRLNHAENVLRHPDGRPAIIVRKGDGARRILTRRALYEAVSCAAQALEAAGIGEGDAVGADFSDEADSIVLFLAASAIGAVWSTCTAAKGRIGGETLDAFVEAYRPQPIVFNRLPFRASLAVLSDGSVHGSGLLLRHLREQRLHCDIGAGERILSLAGDDDMAWHWRVSALALGAELVLCEAAFLTSQPARLFDLIEDEAISVLSLPFALLDASAQAGLRPCETHRFSTLRTIVATGVPPSDGLFDHVYRDWKADVHFAPACGGLLGGNPLLPVRRGEWQGAMLGLDLDVLDDGGRPVSGAPGALVCRNAHLAMPLKFLGDEGGGRYRAALPERVSSHWMPGIRAERRPSGGHVVHGLPGSGHSFRNSCHQGAMS